MQPQILPGLVGRFETNFKRSTDLNDCWIWLYGTNSSGYGQFRIENSMYLAHRISYLIYKGNYGDEDKILHTCHIPRCINPRHLKIGTQQENMDDMVKAGRSPNKRGSNNGRTLLTEDDVREIRSLYDTTPMTHKQLANKYGLSSATIDSIVNRRTWIHI